MNVFRAAGFTLALTLQAGVCAADKGQAPPREPEGLAEVGEKLRVAILARDVEAILRYLPDDGLPCGDAIVESEFFRKEIRKKGSQLHCFFFDEEAWQARFRSDRFPASLEAEVKKGERIRVERPRVPGPSEEGCVVFSAAQNFGSRVCFIVEKGRWVYSGPPLCDL